MTKKKMTKQSKLIDSSNLSELRLKFQSLSPKQKAQYISTLPPKAQKYLYETPELWLFDKQIIPTDKARYTLLMCGRGFGKTTSGSAHVAAQIKQGVKSIGLCGAKYSDVKQDMIPGILKWFDRDFISKIQRNDQEHILYLPNGCVIKYYSSDTEIRGPNLELLWCDEICKWCDSIPEKVQECFDLLDMTVRVGKHPKVIITSTPKSFPFFKEFQQKIVDNNPAYNLITGTMFDNPYLPQSFINSMLEKHGGTRLGRQELYGELLADAEGALWNHKMLDDCHLKTLLPMEKLLPMMIRIVVAIDPAVTNNQKSDETGIIVAGLGIDGKVYVLKDLSGKFSPKDWATHAINAYREFKADKIIAEKNNGGDLVEMNLRSVNPTIPVKTIHASRGKIVRAEPVAALYEQKRVYHNGIFKTLEDQMCSFTGDPKQQSPDRMDALVYAISELALTASYARVDATWAPQF